MNNENKNLEIKVGIFVFIGLLAIAIMAIQFGRLGQGLTKFYELKVEFTNAGGLLKNSDVQLAGAVIGHVVEKPSITPGKVGTVTVRLRIRDTVRLPRGSSFQIGSSGLMGDKTVSITPPTDFVPEKFNPSDDAQVYLEDETIRGSEGGGIEALTRKSEEAMEKLSVNLDEMRIAINKLHSNLLSDENLANFSASLNSIKTTGENFAQASQRLDSVVAGAQEAVELAKRTMTTGNVAVEDVRLAIADAREAIKVAQDVLKNAQGILKTAQTGSGPIPMLLNNREVADNLNALITNIRRHGMLFYRDSAAREQQNAPVAVPIKTQTRGARPASR